MHYLIHELPVVDMHAPQPSNIPNELPGPVCVAHQHHSSVQLCKRVQTVMTIILNYNFGNNDTDNNNTNLKTGSNNDDDCRKFETTDECNNNNLTFVTIQLMMSRASDVSA